MHPKILKAFLTSIQTLPTDQPLTKRHLLTESFLIETDDQIKMYVAPHNEYINKEAKIVIVGITPGWQQMKIAFHAFVKTLESGSDLDECFYQAKITAGLAGSIRTNLIDMLDHCDLPNVLRIPTSADLFEKGRHFLHTTSIIKYPVFVHNKNYTGYNPPINRSTLLQHYAYREFPKELAQIKSTALVIPLGKTVENALLQIKEQNLLPSHTYLTGFPHPSGANGHRVKQFNQQREQLHKQITLWADQSINKTNG